MSKIEDEVCEEIKERAKRGLAKYGTTMERTDLGITDWLQHAKEEALDLAVYLQRLHHEYERLEKQLERAESLVEAYATILVDLQGNPDRLINLETGELLDTE
jgi:predicted  nucleic acid-binding Zn-ribbon protein